MPPRALRNPGVTDDRATPQRPGGARHADPGTAIGGEYPRRPIDDRCWITKEASRRPIYAFWMRMSGFDPQGSDHLDDPSLAEDLNGVLSALR